MATRRIDLFRDHHASLRPVDPPTSDPAALKPRNRIEVSHVREVRTDEPRELSNAGLSGSHPEITDIARRDMISRAAYYRAQQRGFAPGEELADWLAAERDVEWFLAGGSPPLGIEDL